MRCCKVIPIYFGDRRESYNSPTNAEEVLKMIKIHINFEKKFNPGVDMDVILVNNINYENQYEPGNVFLRSLDGANSNRGQFRLIERENVGASFGGYNAAYQTFKEEYDYFFFVEDDTIIFEEAYYPKFIDVLSEEKTAFAAMGLVWSGAPNRPLHAQGGCGCAKTTTLNKVNEKFGKLLYYDEKTDDMRNHELGGEVVFTGIYESDFGLEMKNVPGFNPYPINWQDIQYYKENYSRQKHLVNGKHIFSIGLKK